MRELAGGEASTWSSTPWIDVARFAALPPPGRAARGLRAAAGATVELEVRPIYFGQFSILGTTMGSAKDFAALLRAVDEGDWVPVIDSLRPLAEAAAAHERIEAGAHFGKLVLAIA